MKKALLIYNPSSGRKRTQRAQQIAQALGIFRAAGVDADSCATTHNGSAADQTQSAIAAGFDTVIGCGGDGTVNEVLNGLMRSNSDATLGVLPFGSGNVLATDLLLPRRADAAARALLGYQPSVLHPGLIRFQGPAGSQQRYFIVIAGVGSDAELMYRTVVTAKERYGVYAYFLEMFRMMLRRGLPMFKAEWNDEHGNLHASEVAMVMAVRAHKFSGLLSRVRFDVELTRNHYRLLLFHTNKVRHFLNYFVSLTTGVNWRVSQVEEVYSTWFRCTPLTGKNGNTIYSEVDGELLGTLPVEISIDPRTFKLLMPDSTRKRQ